MLRALGARIVRTLALTGLSAALTVGGCEAPQPTSLESGIELRAGDGEPSAWILGEGDEIAQEIVADPAFHELIGVATEIMGDLHAAQSELTDEDVDSIARTTTAPGFAETMSPASLLGYLGGDPADLQRMRSLVDDLRASHGLEDASPEDLQYVFELAIASEHAQGMMTDAVAAELDVVSEWTECEGACLAIYMAGLAIAVFYFILAIVIAAATFPWGIIIAAIATAVFSRTIAELQAAFAQCLAECDGVVVDDDLCGDDLCKPDEYCWTGILGIGADECRPRRESGQTCSNHEACLSGCCKYHVLSDPVSKVCRPSSACG